jgi:hypothetical protein
VTAASLHSIENLGAGPPSPDHPNGIVCSQ